jgi:hypothetical protein
MTTPVSPAPANSRVHFVSVWNPAVQEDALESHLRLLLDFARDVHKGETHDADAYIWWGRLRARDRVAPLPHADHLRALAASMQSEAASREVHLYLTDYSSLYVGMISDLVLEDVRSDDPEHIPGWVREQDRAVRSRDRSYVHTADLWFKVIDIRRLVWDDTREVVQNLARLRDVRDSRTVSPYSGMSDLPRIVTRTDDATFFDSHERVYDSRLYRWVQLDAERGRGVHLVERDLRDNVIGADSWDRFHPSVRGFIATAEKLFRDHRRDPAFDFTPVVVLFAKALEIHSLSLVRAALPRERLDAILKSSDNVTPMIAPDKLTLGQLTTAMRAHPEFRAALERLRDGPWLVQEFRKAMDRFTPSRNTGVHREHIGRELATKWRDELLGVGQAGVLERLAKVESL